MRLKLCEPTPTFLRQRSKRMLRTQQSIPRLSRLLRRRQRKSCMRLVEFRRRPASPMRRRRRSLALRRSAGGESRLMYCDGRSEHPNCLSVTHALRRQQRGVSYASPSCSAARRRSGGVGWWLLHHPRNALSVSATSQKNPAFSPGFLFAASFLSFCETQPAASEPTAPSRCRDLDYAASASIAAGTANSGRPTTSRT